jgi:nitroreductase
MNIIEAIETRRAVKSFDPAYKMPQADEKRLLELAMLSPTAFNIQHWRFVLVKDQELRQKIRAVSWGQAQVTDASLLVIICADTKAWSKQAERYWSNADIAVQNFMLPAIHAYYVEKEVTQRDEALRSAGIAAQTLMLAAKGLGYESCPMDGFDFEQVGKLINLPSDHLISMFVAIGKPLAPAKPRAGQLPFADVVIENQFKI